MKRRWTSVVVACSAVLVPAVLTAAASETATTSITVTAAVSTRTALQVSQDVLRFDLPQDQTAGVAVIEFSAGMRIPSTADVLLTIEPLGSIAGPGGAADNDAAISFDGDGDGTRSGTLGGAAPSIAGRWHGSGLHEGRMRFTLRAPTSGHYELPVRFVLATP